MTRIVQCGWETGDSNQIGAGTVLASGWTLPTAVASSPAPRSGGYCLKCAVAAGSAVGTSGINGSYARQTIPHAALTEVWYAFGFQWAHSSEPSTYAWHLLHVADAGGNANVVLTIDSGTIRAHVATTGGSNPSSGSVTLLGSATASAAAGTWHLVEVRLVASLTTGGTCQVYLNGAQVINATGVRTAQTTATYGAATLGLTAIFNGSGVTAHHAFDDFRVNSTAGSVNNGRPGDESIRLVVPSSPGDLTQLTRGGTDSGANWDQVDEVPASTADYVTGAGAGLTDLYNTTDLAATSVSAVTVLALASNASGGGTVAVVTKTPAGQSAGSPASLSPTWAWTQRLLEADPADGAAWTSAKLSALQIGTAVG